MAWCEGVLGSAPNPDRFPTPPLGKMNPLTGRALWRGGQSSTGALQGEQAGGGRAGPTRTLWVSRQNQELSCLFRSAAGRPGLLGLLCSPWPVVLSADTVRPVSLQPEGSERGRGRSVTLGGAGREVWLFTQSSGSLWVPSSSVEGHVRRRRSPGCGPCQAATVSSDHPERRA